MIGLVLTLAWKSLAVSQERPKRPAALKLPAGVMVLRDLQYVEGGHQRNRLDLYLPEIAEGRLPLVVWIHGGAWLAGSEEGCPAVPLTAKGYAVASLLVDVKGNGHGGPGFNTSENRKLVEDFFARHLRGPSAAKAEAEAAKKPHVLITISKETTYITEPLREDGYVNYLAALNQRFRAGVTAENNAAVPFLKAMGPGEIDAKYREDYFRLLGIPPLPEKGDYFVAVDAYAKAAKDAGKVVTEKDAEKGHDIYTEQLTPAMKRPWSKKGLACISVAAAIASSEVG